MPHCRVQSPDEINVVIVQGVRIPSGILKIVFRHILFFLFFNAVWALTSGGFRIVSDTLVITAQVHDVVTTPHYSDDRWVHFYAN